MGVTVPYSEAPVGLRDVLGWHDPATSDAVAVTERAYAARMAASLSELAKAEGGPAAEEILSQFAALPEDAVRRILLAPETAHRAIKRARGEIALLIPFLKQAIAAERMRRRVGKPVDGSDPALAWSATGDMKLGAVAAGGTVQIVHAAEKLGVLAAVLDWNGWDDGRSAASGFGDMDSLFFGELAIPDEYALAREKLEIAAGVIARTCPLAATFIDGSLCVVHLRQSASAQDAYFSYSQRDTIGRCVLVNAHLPVADIGTIVNALIHEAIHSFLYRLEQTHSLVHLPVAGEQMQTYHSSWSGNRIRVSTYVHACYIYFALAQFWSRPECLALMGEEICQAQLRFLGKGFDGNVIVLEELAGDRHIKPDTLDDILSMTQNWASGKWPETAEGYGNESTG